MKGIGGMRTCVSVILHNFSVQLLLLLVNVVQFLTHRPHFNLLAVTDPGLGYNKFVAFDVVVE